MEGSGKADGHVCGSEAARGADTRALVVSSIYTANELPAQLGREAYSYRFVFHAFGDLLRRWGQTIEIGRPESRLDYACHQARQRGLDPVHLSFLPLHLTYLGQNAPNVAVPAWEFPDIPNRDFGNNPRNNWVRIANCLDVVVTHCNITRNAFLRAGVRTPVHLVPVPIAERYFRVAAWAPGRREIIDCPCYVFPDALPAAAPVPDPWHAAQAPRLGLKARAKRTYKQHVLPRLPGRVDRWLALAVRKLRRLPPPVPVISYLATPRLELSGVVYTSIFNPFDPRKNWHDMISAFLLAFRERPDVTLVLKLVMPKEFEAVGLNGVVDYYRLLKVEHRCKLVLVTAYLSNEQMAQLAHGSTYYVNTSKAEGSCLPLQDFLAAGRPGIAPVHSGIADYMDDQTGFPVAAHPEPAAWPHDPEQRLSSVWHRLVWKSLHDQYRASYDCAVKDVARYQDLAACGRQRLRDFAGAEAVWPCLNAALNEAYALRIRHQPLRAAG